MTRHKYPEAFKLMTYRCQKMPEHEEKVWNSRDGVTPFMLGCLKCNGMMAHVDWQKDEYLPNYIPERGARYFVSMSPRNCKRYGAPQGAPDVRVM